MQHVKKNSPGTRLNRPQRKPSLHKLLSQLHELIEPIMVAHSLQHLEFTLQQGTFLSMYQKAKGGSHV